MFRFIIVKCAKLYQRCTDPGGGGCLIARVVYRVFTVATDIFNVFISAPAPHRQKFI